MAFIALFIASFMFTPHQSSFQEPNASLHYLVREPKVKSAKPPLLLLLHGYGSNEEDLFSLAEFFGDKYLVVSARAPYKISEGSYKWYDLNLENGARSINPQQAEQSRQVILTFLTELKAKHDYDPKQVILCGFSQGAIMSYSVGLSNPHKVQGIIALSGRLLEETKPLLAKASLLKDFKALVVHGRQDNVLPVQNGRDAKAFLEKHQINTTYHEFDMAHTITNEVMAKVVEWLGKL